MKDMRGIKIGTFITNLLWPLIVTCFVAGCQDKSSAPEYTARERGDQRGADLDIGSPNQQQPPNPMNQPTNFVPNGYGVPSIEGSMGQNRCNLQPVSDFSKPGPYGFSLKTVGNQTIIYPKTGCAGSPVIGWGNGTATGMISTLNYGVYLNHLASHGFIVVTDNSSMAMMTDSVNKNIAAGLAFAQRECGSSVPPPVGAAGHSQGGFAAQASKAAAVVSIGAGGRSMTGAPSLALGMAIEANLANYNIEIKGINHITEGLLGGAANSYLNMAMTAWFRGYLCGDVSALAIFSEERALQVSGWGKRSGTPP